MDQATFKASTALGTPLLQMQILTHIQQPLLFQRLISGVQAVKGLLVHPPLFTPALAVVVILENPLTEFVLLVDQPIHPALLL